VVIEDFEDGSAGWTTGSLNANSSTQWELGTPATGQGPGSAFSGSKAYGTNLDSDYEFNTNIFLRSPVIDLTGICQATLTYQGYQDMEPLIDGLFFDFMEIRILDLNGQGIQNSSVRKRAGSTDGWRKEKLRLPSEVLDRRIMIEFSFHSDDFNAIDDESFEEFTQAGWFIDDVTIVPE
jgi:bacillopeptidase F